MAEATSRPKSGATQGRAVWQRTLDGTWIEWLVYPRVLSSMPKSTWWLLELSWTSDVLWYLNSVILWSVWCLCNPLAHWLPFYVSRWLAWNMFVFQLVLLDIVSFNFHIVPYRVNSREESENLLPTEFLLPIFKYEERWAAKCWSSKTAILKLIC